MSNGIEQVEVAAIAPQTPEQRSMIEVAQSRAAQEVQAAMVVAKKFPRDTVISEKRILDACKRPKMAESALYSYPRGSSRVEGESIRLAEVLAQNWGNVESGVVELSRANGESIAMSYCTDLETNVRDVKVFTVKHIRDRSERKGGQVALTDERDIYELVANMGARRKRACILSIIPIDIREAAVEQCRKTLEGDTSVPLIDRVKAMAQAFEPLGVSVEMLQQRLGHNLSATSATELVSLRGIYASLKDGMSNVGDWFEVAANEPKAAGNAAVLAKLQQAQTNGAAKTEQPHPPTPEEVKQQAEQVFGGQGPEPTQDDGAHTSTVTAPAQGANATPQVANGAMAEAEPDGLDGVPIAQAQGQAAEQKLIRFQWVCARSIKHVFNEDPGTETCPKCRGQLKIVEIKF